MIESCSFFTCFFFGEHLHKCAEYQREILNKKLFDIRRHYGLRSDLSLATVPFVILSLL